MGHYWLSIKTEMYVAMIVRLLLATATIAAIEESLAAETCFQSQYALDDAFANSTAFHNVSDIGINQKEGHVLILQRSYPPVSVWSTNGTLLFVWDTQEIGYPHSLVLANQTTATETTTTVWITDMAGELAAGKTFGHCIKQFTYTGKFIGSLGNCGRNTSGSGLNPVQFDRVTDLAINSKGYMYVTDGDVGGINNRVLVFDANRDLVDVWNKENKPGSEPLQFNLPHSIKIDRCDRVWITDTQNHRIQIVSSNGTFLGEWKCFGDSLLYGLDITSSSDYVVITAKTDSGNSEIIFLPIQANDCSQLHNFGNCKIDRRLVVKQDARSSHRLKSSNTMLHSVTVDNDSGSLYLTTLPGSLPPLKFSPVSLPPRSNFNACSAGPNLLPVVWSSTVLLTPFFAEDIQTAHVEYNGDLEAMYVSLYSQNGEIKEYLNIQDKTYILTSNSTSTTCSGPHNYGWSTPSRDWLAPYECECKGELNISGIDTVAWTCPIYTLRNWYWVHSSNGSLWRILFNNQSNPTRLPVIGDYTMAHFSAYTSEAKTLDIVYHVCTQPSFKHSTYSTVYRQGNPVKGFTYTECPSTFSFPSWPEFFHLTVTMIPVVLSNASPFPTQVVYDWELEFQRTTMCETSQTYNAILIHNNTYIFNQKLDTGGVECLSHLPFGPSQPNWMTLDGCKCKGVIEDNPALTPWKKTIIAVCPVAEDRVFWTWFTEDVGFTPLLFFETLTPADEGTGLALADYHSMHKGGVLIDIQEFDVPPECLVPQ